MKKYIIYFYIIGVCTIEARIQRRRNHPQNMLFSAIWRNDVDALRSAIARGANINKVNEFDHTPLMIAAKYNCLEVVQTLVIEYNADINYNNKNNINALVLSIANKNPRVLLFLLNYYTNPATVSINGHTFTSLIKQFGHYQIQQAFNKWQKKYPDSLSIKNM